MRRRKKSRKEVLASTLGLTVMQSEIPMSRVEQCSKKVNVNLLYLRALDTLMEVRWWFLDAGSVRLRV
jgi:hypothetical protein